MHPTTKGTICNFASLHIVFSSKMLYGFSIYSFVCFIETLSSCFIMISFSSRKYRSKHQNIVCKIVKYRSHGEDLKSIYKGSKFLHLSINSLEYLIFLAPLSLIRGKLKLLIKNTGAM